MKPLFNDLFKADAAARPSKPSTSITNRIDNAFADVGAADSEIGSRIANAFDAASETTGTSFDYLVKTAQRESSLDPQAKARTSTATGLFQFIESTWLETMKRSGADLGLSQYADQITVGADGRYSVADPAMREKILALRTDPEVSSMMAGALTRQNAQLLTDRIGRAPTDGELYIAHFLGAGGASKLIQLAEKAPDVDAAKVFPAQAKANRSIFFEKGGDARSVSEVYDRLVKTHDAPTVTMLAAVTRPAPAGTEATAYATEATAYAAGASETANRIESGWRAADPDSAFDALFRDKSAADVPMATAFWKGYAATPGLFAVAMAEDEAAERARTPAAVDAATPLPAPRPRPASAAVAGAAESLLGNGPLDLGAFVAPEARRRI